MTTSIDTSSDSRSTSTPRRTATTWLFRLGVVLVLLLLVGTGLWLGLRLSRSGVLPGTRVEGINVSGMSQGELRETVEDLAQRYHTETVTAALGDGSRTASNAELGYVLNVDETVERVWRRGRHANPVVSLAQHLRAFQATVDVTIAERLDANELRQWAADTAAALEIEPVEGNVTLEGAEVSRTSPREGAVVQTDALVSSAEAAVYSPGPDTIEVPFDPVETMTTTADVEEAFTLARRAVSGPIVLSRNEGTIALEPAEIGDLIQLERSLGDDDASFDFTLPSAALAATVSDETIDALESEPVDAGITLEDGEIVISEAQEGFAFDLQAAAAQILDIALTEPAEEGPREAALAGEVLEPDRTTQEAEDLQIVEEVSSFTTHHQCCEQRVTNIHRFADIVDGAVIEPGETFSLNGHVGERTREKGFVGGGAILRGEYVEQVGGGVSQFATTFFNAAYFGGYEILDHKPHSYYISRYPVGRESTINWPNVDVEIENNSPYGILVDTSYTSTSITVTFWGKNWVEVESVTGEPHNYRQPDVDYRENNDLPPGESRVIQQAGGPGFDIVVTRILTYPDGETEREEFFTRYLPEDRIVERNT